MLASSASYLGLRVSCLSPKADDPAWINSTIVVGNPKNSDDVASFGADCDVVTVEFDDADVEGLRRLKAQGKQVHPDPEALAIIQDKGLQSQFYQEHGLPTPRFELLDSPTDIRKAVEDGRWSFPFILKTRRAGYDGKGVQVLKDLSDLEKLSGEGWIAQEKVDIDKELAVIAIRNGRGEVKAYPATELVAFDGAYLLDHLLVPADINEELENKASKVAKQLIDELGIQGLLAVEFFIDKKGNMWINEVSPRPHNTGHQTIESGLSSQYDQHLRGILDLPLGEIEQHGPSAMLNLLGEPDHSGPTKIDGLEEVLAMEGVKVHLYGKMETKPYRKMGHVTILAKDRSTLLDRITKVRNTLKVVST